MTPTPPFPRRIAGLLLVAVCLAAPVRAEEDDCAVPMADWQPREAVSRMAHEHGWVVRRIKIDDGCYEIIGRDAEGRAIEVYIHPGTLEILELEFEDEDQEHEDEEDREGEGHDND